jgi:hypothetical protein
VHGLILPAPFIDVNLAAKKPKIEEIKAPSNIILNQDVINRETLATAAILNQYVTNLES